MWPRAETLGGSTGAQPDTAPLPLGALPAHRWDNGLATFPPGPDRGWWGEGRPAAREAAGGEGRGTGPQMPTQPPFLVRGPHGVGEQEESIRIMKPQPATHRGGTEEAGPVPSPPDGSKELRPGWPGGGGAARQRRRWKPGGASRERRAETGRS